MERSSVLLQNHSLNTMQDSINILGKILGEQARNLNSKLNLIDSKNISFINSTSLFNSIFTEFYGEMYHHFVLVRKYIYSNQEFLKNNLNVLLKIVHPNIQIFYGLMLTQDQKEDLYNFHCVFEYFNGINLCDIDYLKPYINQKEENFLKLLLADRIAQTLSFIYKSGYPHLMINGKNIKLNHNLIMDRHQHNKVIYCDNSYIYANIIKLNEIGSYFKYNKTFNIFCLQNEDIYEISFHSPELLSYLDIEKVELERKTVIMEKWDIWSFGCILFELFTEKRPFNHVIDKNSLIKTICSMKKQSDFVSANKEDLELISNENVATVGDSIRALICACTCREANDRPDFSKIVEVLSDLVKQFKADNFTTEEIQKFKKEVELEDINYYDFKRFEDTIKLTNHIKKSEDLSSDIIPLTKELEEIENEYNNRLKEIENSKLKQQFNKDGTSVKPTVSYTGNNYFIKYLMFTKKKVQKKDKKFYDKFKFSDNKEEQISSDLIYVFDIYRDETMVCDLKNSPSEDVFTILPDSTIYFSFIKKKMYVSGGTVYFVENEELGEEGKKKRTNAFGVFYAEAAGEKDEQIFNFENLTFQKPKFMHKKTEDDIKIIKESTTPTRHLNRLNTKSPIMAPLQLDKKHILTFSYNEKSTKQIDNPSNEYARIGFNSEEVDVVQQKVCYYHPFHKHMIKRTDHSIIEIQNYLFFIGGEQSRKCEIWDLRDNHFYFIEELNTIHINPIVFLKEKKIVSLNFENIKKHYSEFMKEDLIPTRREHRASVNSSGLNSIRKLSKEKSVQFFNLKEMKTANIETEFRASFLKTSNFNSAPSHIKKHMIFCESYDTTELTSNPKWVIEEVKFNLGNNFSFDNFIHYKYLIIGEEMIYIIGSNKLYNPNDTEFKFSGLCYNIDKLEFTPLDKRTLLKLDPLKTSLGMGSNIIFYNNNYYFLNCISNKVEKLPFNSLFS